MREIVISIRDARAAGEIIHDRFHGYQSMIKQVCSDVYQVESSWLAEDMYYVLKNDFNLEVTLK
jgi:hypothetical protein